ncbi:MAG: hypothetical protein EPO00_02245, partial [Chloroflexota bacterium]
MSRPRPERLDPPLPSGLADAIYRQPAAPDLLETAGVAAYRLGDLEAAMVWLGRATAPILSPRILGNLGVVAWQTRKPEIARRLFRRALSLDPASAPTHNSLGVAFGRACPGVGAALHQ